MADEKVFEPFFVTKLTDHTFIFNERGSSSSVLVIGSKLALVIDTLNGWNNCRKEFHKYTDEPLFVVNTHAHCDHIGGNIYFDEVHINYDDLPLLKTFPDSLKVTKVSPLKIGQIIDLGDGHEVEVLSCKGHTQGSVVLLDRYDKTLYSGDAIIAHEWLQLPEATTVETYYEELTKLMPYRHCFDKIITGHGCGYEDASLFDNIYAEVKKILAGDTENDVKLTDDPYAGECMVHFYGDPNKGNRILYQVDKIR